MVGLEPQAMSYEIDAFGGVSREDDLGRRGIQERRNLLTGALVGSSHLVGEDVHAPMDVGREATVHLDDGVDHAFGLGGGRSAVEVDDRMAVDLAPEQREVRPGMVERLGPALPRRRHANSSFGSHSNEVRASRNFPDGSGESATTRCRVISALEPYTVRRRSGTASTAVASACGSTQ